MVVFVIDGPKGRLRVKGSGTRMFPTQKSSEDYVSKLPSPEKYQVKEVIMSKYAENDQMILLRWQIAKHWHDRLEEFEVVADPPWDRCDRDRDILNEYGVALAALRGLTDSTLAAKVERVHLNSPAGGNSETPEGRIILAAAATDMRAARQELFDISLKIKDLRPPESKPV